jgi:hypothetical protein
VAMDGCRCGRVTSQAEVSAVFDVVAALIRVVGVVELEVPASQTPEGEAPESPPRCESERELQETARRALGLSSQ